MKDCIIIDDTSPDAVEISCDTLVALVRRAARIMPLFRTRDGRPPETVPCRAEHDSLGDSFFEPEYGRNAHRLFTAISEEERQRLGQTLITLIITWEDETRQNNIAFQTLDAGNAWYQ